MRILVTFLLSMGMFSGSSAPIAASPAYGETLITASDLLIASGPVQDDYDLSKAGKKWMRLKTPDKPGATKGAIFAIFPSQFTGSSSGLKPPRALVMCANNKMYTLIETEPLKDGNVKFKFDNGSLLSQTWKTMGTRLQPSTEDSTAILKELAASKSFKFEYTPEGHPTQTTTFSSADYQESVLKDPLCKP